VIVRYSVIEAWLADEGVWFPWGVFYENRSDDFADYTLLIRAILDADRRKGRYFDRRSQELRPSIEEAEVVLGEYADGYRVRPEIRTVKSTSHREIRALLVGGDLRGDREANGGVSGRVRYTGASLRGAAGRIRGGRLRLVCKPIV